MPTTKLPSLVYFYAPWCPHCISFTPMWDALTKMIPQNEMNTVKIDCVAKNGYCQRIKLLRGYPSIYYVPVSGTPLYYTGPRQPSYIIDFINHVSNKKLIKI